MEFPQQSPLSAKLSAHLGGRTAAALGKSLGLVTVGDLLTHYPRRYARRGELTELSRLPLNEEVTIVAEVLEVTDRAMRARKGSILEVKISDGVGILSLTFFNQGWRAKELQPGVRGIFAGKVGEYRGRMQLTHPNYELFESDALAHGESPQEWALTPIPIYPATASVSSWQLRKSVEIVLDSLGELVDPVPDEVRIKRNLLPFSQAISFVHRPATDADWKAARKSLRFQEAFVLQATMLQQRQHLKSLAATPRVAKLGGLLESFDQKLPFALTEDQKLVGASIAEDIAGQTPMNRLLQGEVGSGKTLVALRAMLTVADSGGQSVLLAPTEVLAGQHLRSIVKLLGPDLAALIRPTLITGQLPTSSRKKALLAAVSGQAQIVIGTHALLSDTVSFFDLGLIVVDEQHRFGVEQREVLRRKGSVPPHVLVLTATPIPRTVVMTVFGDLDVSTITELPAGRQGIETFVVPLGQRPGWECRIWTRLAEELALGRQAFVVCPAIEPASLVEPPSSVELGPTPPVPDEASASGGRAVGIETAAPSASVTDTLAALRNNPLFVDFRIEALHGRIPSEEKDELMRGFSAGEIDVLVATTVIEVGVDVPNASTMIVLDADRFGISQLHQLRGRVGRGSVPGLCLLVTSAEADSPSLARVEAVASTLDGFELANRDLELRKEGDVLGSEQSGGRSGLRLLRVAKDGELISEARALALQLLDKDPQLVNHPALQQAIELRLSDSERDFLAKY